MRHQAFDDRLDEYGVRTPGALSIVGTQANVWQRWYLHFWDTVKILERHSLECKIICAQVAHNPLRIVHVVIIYGVERKILPTAVSCSCKISVIHSWIRIAIQISTKMECLSLVRFMRHLIPQRIS